MERWRRSCLELALEGERLCKVDDYRTCRYELFRPKMTFYDAILRTIRDQQGEAKASGNLGNTLKVLGRFDEALVCCQRHLDIAVDLRGRCITWERYHAKGKTICWSERSLESSLRRANLSIVKELGDCAAQGRTYGNLVASHEQRRAYCNLGNAYIFLGEFEVAAEHYKRTLQLARLLKDRAVEAQACYSLGNTYTLLQDYDRAIDYHLKHLIIAQDLNDRIGEGRACWSLGNAHTALGNHDQAMHFAEKHLEISKETGDRSGELTARMNVSDLQMVLGLSYRTNDSTLSENPIKDIDYNLHGARPRMGRRHSMENLELMKLTPDKINAQKWNSDILTKQSKPTLAKSSSKLFFVSRLRGKKHKAGGSSKVLQDTSNTPQTPYLILTQRASPDMLGDEGFFDLLSRFQSNRMDDQRCSIQDKSSSDSPARAMRKCKTVSESAAVTGLGSGSGSQGCRLEDGGGAGGSLPVLRVHQNRSQAVLSHLMANADNSEPDDDFFNMLVKCQGSRLDDQRCAPPPARGPTVPDEDFFSLIMRSQAKRMDEQRVTLPSAARPCSN
uniref:G protein signaling modulator 2 n=1 Tax=Salmo trutta TaxID=8032 RepID=A0A674A9F7_SALTR